MKRIFVLYQLDKKPKDKLVTEKFSESHWDFIFLLLEEEKTLNYRMKDLGLNQKQNPETVG